MDKPGSNLWKTQARPLADILRNTIKDAFAKQGFAATELVTRWPRDRRAGDRRPLRAGEDPVAAALRQTDDQQPGTLVLRVEGPTAIEIQHLSRIILERVNRFFGWQAVTDLRLRQAPLGRREKPAAPVVGSRSGGAHRRHRSPRSATRSCGRRWRASAPRSGSPDGPSSSGPCSSNRRHWPKSPCRTVCHCHNDAVRIAMSGGCSDRTCRAAYRSNLRSVL